MFAKSLAKTKQNNNTNRNTDEAQIVVDFTYRKSKFEICGQCVKETTDDND